MMGAGYVLVGLAQVAGVTLIVAGAASRKSWWQLDAEADAGPELQLGLPSVAARPDRNDSHLWAPGSEPRSTAGATSGLSLRGAF